MTSRAEPSLAGAGTGPAHAVRSLLDKGSITRLMVLRAVGRGETRTLRRVADEIGVTIQAVSEHLKRLSAAGLVADHGDGPRLTREGHEALAAQLTTLKRYVDGAVRDLARIDKAAARAATALQAGDSVGLFMEDGELVARRDTASPSRGVAQQDAAAGQDVLIGDLEGIVELEAGNVTILVVPDAAEGGSRDVDPNATKRHLAGAGIIAAQGPVARHVAEAAGYAPIRFAAATVAAEAALVGVDAVILVESSRVDELQERFARACQEWGFESQAQVKRMQ